MIRYYLYLIKPSFKTIKYIGITTDCNRRETEHREKYPNAKFVVIAISFDKFWIKKLEQLMIENYGQYIDNKQHNSYKSYMSIDPNTAYETVTM